MATEKSLGAAQVGTVSRINAIPMRLAHLEMSC